MAEAAALNNKDLILETIDQLRKRKARPDLERICHMLERRYAVSCAQTEADLAKLVADAIVIKVDYKGSTSYRNAAKWGRRNSACPGPQPQQQPLPQTPPPFEAPPTKTEPASATTAAAARIAEEAPRSKNEKNDGGACIDDIEKYLSANSISSSKPNTIKVNKNSLQLSLNREVSAGRLKKLSCGKYVCVQPLRQPPIVTSSQIVLVAVTASAAAAGKASSGDGDAKSTEEKKQDAAGIVVQLPDAAVAVPTEDADDGKKKMKDEKVAGDSQVSAVEAERKSEETESCQSQVAFQPPQAPSAAVSRGIQTTAAANRGVQTTSTRKSSRHLSSNYNKRKRFKKTHGPDFVEDYDSSFEETADTKCDYCLLTADCNRNGEREDLLVCKDCLAKAHPSCMDYSKELAARSHMSPWQCTDCKTCFICNDSGDGSTMLFCDSCDKGYHMGCHEPKVVGKPTGKWMCHSCCSEKDSPSEETKDTDVNPEKVMESDDCSHSPVPAQNGHSSTEDSGGSQDMDTTMEIDSTNHTVDGAVGLPTPCDSPVPDEPNDRKSFGSILIPGNINGQVNNTVRLINGKKNESEVPDASDWSIEDVVKYFQSAGFPEQAVAFGEQEIDGKSLLLMKRNDVLTGLSIKLGPALKIYNHVKRLQMRIDDTIS